MWEWREERGRWRLDDTGSWNWDEPALLERVGSAPFGASGPAAARGPVGSPGAGPTPLAPPASVPPPPPPSPRAPSAPPAPGSAAGGPWTPPEPWRRGPSPAVPYGSRPLPAGRPEPADAPWLPELAGWAGEAGPSFPDLPDLPVARGAAIGSEETPIFAAVAEDHEREEDGTQRLRPSRHGVPEEPGHPGAADRREYRTAPWIPDPSPGSGPFAVPGGRWAPREAAARHARTDAGALPTADGSNAADAADAADAAARHDGRHALRR